MRSWAPLGASPHAAGALWPAAGAGHALIYSPCRRPRQPGTEAWGQHARTCLICAEFIRSIACIGHGAARHAAVWVFGQGVAASPSRAHPHFELWVAVDWSVAWSIGEAWLRSESTGPREAKQGPCPVHAGVLPPAAVRWRFVKSPLEGARWTSVTPPHFARRMP